MVDLKNSLTAISHTLLGWSNIQVDFIVVTPLRSVYKKICEHWQSVENQTGGFYQNALLKRRGKTCLFVCIPQGIQAQDFFYIPKGCRILFLGFAGSLDKRFTIGNILEINQAVMPDGIRYSLSKTGIFEHADCGYAPCLLGKLAEQYCAIAEKNECQLIDMETSYCSAIACERKNRLTAWLLVTDQPSNINFWELDEKAQKCLEEGLQEALRAVFLLCEEMISYE